MFRELPSKEGHMSIATSVQNFLSREGIAFEVLAHDHTANSARTAQAARVPGDRLAKAVVLKDEQGYLMAVVPATHRVDLGELHRHLHRELGLATEDELPQLFVDCEPGAVPPLGRAYGIGVVLDESLVGAPDVYFEAGDHYALMRVSGRDFLKLMADAPRAAISHHV
jgi:Ala-tRNA(Pro) deacylase